MAKYWIRRLQVRKVWGYRNFDVPLKKDVNILVGENASGKTTLLNLMHFVLTGDVVSLSDINFEEIRLELRSFDGDSRRTVSVTETSSGFRFRIAHEQYDVAIEPYMRRGSMVMSKQNPWMNRRMQEVQVRNMQDTLSDLVPAVWLPVSRRLPISDEEERTLRERSRRAGPIESVDERLRQLIGELHNYRLRLEPQLSELHKSFEKQVIQRSLISKEHDRMKEYQDVDVPTKEDKEQLMRAFRAVDLLDGNMEKRVEEHFRVSALALKRIEKANKPEDIKPEDVLLIPLIWRTKSMVQFSGQLEEDRKKLFAPLRRYESTVNSFLAEKEIHVLDTGELRITSSGVPTLDISPEVLSSGEKQILILMTQALLFEDQPVVYVADEPELSLHVKWQERLLESLRSLGREIQIIVATHSPDIVGPFRDRIIELDKVAV